MPEAAATRSAAVAISRPLLDRVHWLDIRRAAQLANDTNTQLVIHGVLVMPSSKPLPPGLIPSTLATPSSPTTTAHKTSALSRRSQRSAERLRLFRARMRKRHCFTLLASHLRRALWLHRLEQMQLLLLRLSPSPLAPVADVAIADPPPPSGRKRKPEHQPDDASPCTLSTPGHTLAGLSAPRPSPAAGATSAVPLAFLTAASSPPARSSNNNRPPPHASPPSPLTARSVVVPFEDAMIESSFLGYGTCPGCWAASREVRS